MVVLGAQNGQGLGVQGPGGVAEGKQADVGGGGELFHRPVRGGEGGAGLLEARVGSGAKAQRHAARGVEGDGDHALTGVGVTELEHRAQEQQNQQGRPRPAQDGQGKPLGGGEVAFPAVEPPRPGGDQQQAGDGHVQADRVRQVQPARVVIRQRVFEEPMKHENS